MYYRRLPEGHRAPIPGAAMPAVRRSAGRDCRLLWANQAGKVGSLVNGDDPSRSSHLAHAVRPERVLPREQQAQARHRGPRGRGCTHHVRDDSRPPRGELSRRKSTGDRHTVDVEESGNRLHQLALVEEVTGVALLLRRACGLASTLDYATFGGLHTGVGACSNAMVRQCCEHPDHVPHRASGSGLGVAMLSQGAQGDALGTQGVQEGNAVASTAASAVEFPDEKRVTGAQLLTVCCAASCSPACNARCMPYHTSRSASEHGRHHARATAAMQYGHHEQGVFIRRVCNQILPHDCKP